MNVYILSSDGRTIVLDSPVPPVKRLMGCPHGGNFHFCPACAVLSSWYLRSSDITWCIRLASSCRVFHCIQSASTSVARSLDINHIYSLTVYYVEI